MKYYVYWDDGCCSTLYDFNTFLELKEWYKNNDDYNCMEILYGKELDGSEMEELYDL